MLKGYRTLLFNTLAALFVVADVVVQMAGMPELDTLIPDSWRPVFTSVLILANILLRLKTTTPVGKSF